mmetsp:Transcript_18459/g.8602  ORF Transcript_18459/g.8602 Transcript_18459/m.8602 type:complete len:209 (+) Transcript_18459:1519-2145(+)
METPIYYRANIMNKLNNALRFGFISMIVMSVCLHILGCEVFASEAESSWRPIYDIIMRWLNFLILAFLIIKFSKKPLKDFLHKERENIASEIEKVEQEKQKVSERIKEANKLLEESNVRFKQLEERIIEQGRRRKQEIIIDAKKQSKLMLQTAKQRIDNYILKAQAQLKSEMIDEAFVYAFEKLPEKVTDKDNYKLVDVFLEQTLRSH